MRLLAYYSLELSSGIALEFFFFNLVPSARDLRVERILISMYRHRLSARTAAVDTEILDIHG